MSSIFMKKCSAIGLPSVCLEVTYVQSIVNLLYIIKLYFMKKLN